MQFNITNNIVVVEMKEKSNCSFRKQKINSIFICLYFVIGNWFYNLLVLKNTKDGDECDLKIFNFNRVTSW